MSNENSGDHSFLLCELAAILAMLAAAPLAVGQPVIEQAVMPKTSPEAKESAAPSLRESITYEHVYGNKLISIGAFSPTRITWLDDEAKQACVMSAYKQWNTLDTLAAALAENGQFAEAEKWLETALTLAPEDVKQSLQAHLDQVLAQKPIRD